MNDGIFKQIGERLAGEMKRIGLSQLALADACEANRGTIATWMKGEQTPNAAALYRMAAAGIDVLFVITGQRSGDAALSAEQSALLASYDKADDSIRAALLAVASVAGRPAPKRSGGSTVTIGGDVGQSIEGDVTISAPMSFKFGGKKKGKPE